MKSPRRRYGRYVRALVYNAAMFAGKPVIGILGGIGSGKSYIADFFGALGCAVSRSDDDVREAYERPEVVNAIRQWWGDEVVGSDGKPDRKAIARRVFSNPRELKRLEALIHPLVNQIRQHHMAQRAGDSGIKAFVWDIPLLVEVGLNRECDALVFVDVPLEKRLERVQQNRGWAAQDLLEREKSQLPLDKKRLMAHYIVDNTADAAYARRQVKAVLSRVLTQSPDADPHKG